MGRALFGGESTLKRALIYEKMEKRIGESIFFETEHFEESTFLGEEHLGESTFSGESTLGRALL